MIKGQINYEKEDESLIAKYDTLINYIKQLYLHISVGIRDGRQNNNRQMLRSMIASFDKAIEDYNQYQIFRRNNIHEHFWVDPALLFSDEPLTPVIVRKIENDAFTMNLIFRGSPIEGYRMHCQIWKNNGFTKDSSMILRKFDQTFMSYLRDKFIADHLVSECVDSGFKIRSSKPRLIYNTRDAQKKPYADRLFSVLQKQAKEYLQMMKQRSCCPYCKKYMLYETRHKIFCPPTILIDIGTKQRPEMRFLHDTCSVRIFRKQEHARHPQN